jgi:hypothetical protein
MVDDTLTWSTVAKLVDRIGTPERTRTSGLLLRRQALYPLSYGRLRLLPEVYPTCFAIEKWRGATEQLVHGRIRDWIWLAEAMLRDYHSPVIVGVAVRRHLVLHEAEAQRWSRMEPQSTSAMMTSRT